MQHRLCPATCCRVRRPTPQAALPLPVCGPAPRGAALASDLPPTRGKSKVSELSKNARRIRPSIVYDTGRPLFWAWFKRRSQLRGAWGRRPKGDAPRSVAGAGGSLAVSSPTPATPLLSPAKIRELNHAAFASLSYPTDRQVLRNPHVGRPGFLVSMSRHPRTAARPGRHAGLLLTPNCQSRSARSQHT